MTDEPRVWEADDISKEVTELPRRRIAYLVGDIPTLRHEQSARRAREAGVLSLRNVEDRSAIQ